MGRNYLDKGEWRYTAVSITKYDPLYRDDLGHYTKDEWTSISDIGKTLEGETLTLAEYLKIEESYVCAALMFAAHVEAKSFKILRYSFFFPTVKKGEFKKRNDEDLWPFFRDVNFTENYNLKLLPYCVKLSLREWGHFSIKLNDKNKSTIHFGYDYYMYFNSNKDFTTIYDNIKALGLFPL